MTAIVQELGGWGVAFALLMFAFCGLTFLVRTKGGWGPFNVQAFALSIVVPTVIMLAATKAVPDEAVSAILGGLVGFVARGAPKE